MSRRDDETWVRPTRIPADVEKEDQLLFGLSGRQVLILAGLAGLLYAAWQALHRFVPGVIVLAGAAAVAMLGLALVLGRRDGISLDRLALHGLRHARTPHRGVNLPDGQTVTAPPAWIDQQIRAQAMPLPATLPAVVPGVGIDPEGVVDLDGDGHAVVLALGTINLALRTGAEQQALLGAFGGVLHGLAGPAQFLIRARPIDLSGQIGELVEAAPSLAHPALEAAAREHAAYLSELASHRELVARQCLLVLRDPTGASGAAGRLLGRAADTAHALSALGITAAVLDGSQAGALLASACDPGPLGRPAPAGLAPPGAVVTGPQPVYPNDDPWTQTNPVEAVYEPTGYPTDAYPPDAYAGSPYQDSAYAPADVEEDLSWLT